MAWEAAHEHAAGERRARRRLSGSLREPTCPHFASAGLPDSLICSGVCGRCGAFAGRGGVAVRLGVQAGVAQALRMLFPELEFEEEFVDPESGYSIDVRATGRGAGHASHRGSRAEDRGWAVEVDGPTHFLKGESWREPSGSTLLKRTQLEQLGYTAVSVPYWEWDALQGKVVTQQEGGGGLGLLFPSLQLRAAGGRGRTVGRGGGAILRGSLLGQEAHTAPGDAQGPSLSPPHCKALISPLSWDSPAKGRRERDLTRSHLLPPAL
ncbi:hypothetical protein T484DRAFT_3524169 [Baffinella frigidus]|nr:hypothetical protein T484DRAFT_3524169 [Cryptophyta sp. CCMP2293]